MKKTFIIAILTACVCLTACTSKKEQQMKEQMLRDSFNNVIKEQGTQVETLLAQITEIDENLNVISSKYEDLQAFANASEVDKNKAQSIGEKINAIAELLAKDKERISALEANLASQKNSFAANKKLQEKINEMNQRVAEQENQLAALTQQLQDKNVQLDNLNAQVTKLQQENKKTKSAMSALEDERYSAYFIVGTKKELKKAGVIDSKGGFIGIGKTLVLASNGNIQNMQKIDMRNINEIPLTGQKVKLITPHPTTSYTLTGNPSKPASIVIESIDEFWKNSRCLVIMVK
ncbi:MAG: hypothetical protein MJZ71_08165 [Bacteroidales bacterium]|nr:hypothetical protein [Bacteroidales bacterium]